MYTINGKYRKEITSPTNLEHGVKINLTHNRITTQNS